MILYNFGVSFISSQNGKEESISAVTENPLLVRTVSHTIYITVKRLLSYPDITTTVCAGIAICHRPWTFESGRCRYHIINRFAMVL